MTSEVRDNRINNSTIDGKVQQQNTYNNIGIPLETVGEQMRVAAITEQNLKEQTERLRNTNEELEKVKENYKDVTEKVQKVAIEHPVPETENQVITIQQIAGIVSRLDKDSQERKIALQKQEKEKSSVVCQLCCCTIRCICYTCRCCK